MVAPGRHKYLVLFRVILSYFLITLKGYILARYPLVSRCEWYALYKLHCIWKQTVGTILNTDCGTKLCIRSSQVRCVAKLINTDKDDTVPRAGAQVSWTRTTPPGYK